MTEISCPSSSVFKKNNKENYWNVYIFCTFKLNCFISPLHVGICIERSSMWLIWRLACVCMTSHWPPAIINNTHIQICWQEPLRKLDQPSANGIITTIKWELMAFRRQEKFRNQSKLHKKTRGHSLHQARNYLLNWIWCLLLLRNQLTLLHILCCNCCIFIVLSLEE